MALISMSAYSDPKRRPTAYKAVDAAYSVGGNPGYYIAARPRKYPKSGPQRVIKAMAAECRIASGMTKSELQTQMKECVTAERWDTFAAKIGVARRSPKRKR